ncbi:MAG: ATP-binding cassette domain-containing protein [Nostocales cyanobacterium]|nr:MAG: ATP-binding cassette domain-containing protein [Nostocales cyanobacterium]
MFSSSYLESKITTVLGENISSKSLQKCLLELEILTSKSIQLLWQPTTAKSGIYIILSGKVRLLDNNDNLITSLDVGDSYGELVLFPEEKFQPYVIRTSTELNLCYLNGYLLNNIIKENPSVKNILKYRAENRDLLLLLYQKSKILYRRHQFLGLSKALSLFERHQLKTSAEIQTLTDGKLWVLYQGEIIDDEGVNLASGVIFNHVNQKNWQVLKPPIVYILREENLQKAVEYCQKISEFLPDNPDTQYTINQPVSYQKYRRKPPLKKYPTTKIIPFTNGEFKEEETTKKSLSYFPSPGVKIGHWWGSFTKKYPFLAQQSAADCGAACLVMVGMYWGKNLSINNLREMTNVNRNGASLKALGTTAESLGFISRPVKATLEKLAEQPLPAIAHWEGKHFIVVYEISKTKVIVCDPAIGKRSLNKAEFTEHWSGYALLLEPTNLLKKTKDEKTNFWKFYELVKPHYWTIAEILTASVLIQLFGLITPIFTQLLLDRVLVQRSINTLNAVGLGMIFFGLFSIAINSVRQYLLDHTANKISISLLVGFIKHTFKLPLSYFESRYVGDIVSRIQENQKIQQFLTGQTLSILLDMLTLVVYLVLMFSYSSSMALFVLCTVPPFFILALASTGILRQISREIFNAGTKESSYLIEALTGIRTVRSLAIEETVRWHWEGLLNDLVKKAFNAQIVGNRLQIISGTIQTFVNTSLLWYGAYQVINEQLTIGQLIAFNMLVGNVLSPFHRLSLLWNELQEIIISTERINDVLAAETEEDLQRQSFKILDKLNGDIQFDQVTFRYHPESETNVLENLSFEIKPGQMIALVGRSGSGKTTLSKLILGLYIPTAGKILIDGFDIRNISLRTLRSQVGVVDQDTFLFGGTIRENIAIAHPEASLEDIIYAAKLAGADEFIQKLPMGYESQIGEGGGMLSGGQRQRLAIARALMGNPSLLLFDEATSHLDAESERIIQNNLKTIIKGRTSIIIAHRLSTVRYADLILVLDHGVLVESGTHDELMAQQGHYYYLNQQQL